MRRTTPREDGYDAMLGAIEELIEVAAKKLPPRTPFIIGIGIPGSLDETTGLVRNVNSTCLIGHPLPADIERLIGKPGRGTMLLR